MKSQDSRHPYKDKKKKKNVSTDKSCHKNFIVFIYLYSRSKHSKKSIHFNFFSQKKKTSCLLSASMRGQRMGKSESK